MAVSCMQGMKAAGMRRRPSTSRATGRWWRTRTRRWPVDRRPRAELDGELLPYRALDRQRPWASIMVAHVLFPEGGRGARPASRAAGSSRTALGLGVHGRRVFGRPEHGGALSPVRHRAGAACTRRGCDLLPLCNDREAVLAVLGRTRRGVRSAEPGAARAPARTAGCRTASRCNRPRVGLECRAAVDHCRDDATLRLDA